MLDKLKALADHLEGLDDQSRDAKAIRWAIKQIDKPAASDRAQADAEHFGIGFTRKRPDGAIEYLPFDQVTIYRGDPLNVEMSESNPAICLLGDLQRLELRPGDRFVLLLRHTPTEQALASIYAGWNAFMGEHAPPLMVLDEGMKLGVLNGDKPN